MDKFIKVDEGFIKRSIEFAEGIINRDDQFHRLVPAGIDKKSQIAKDIAIQRTLMGKLGECAFLQLLWNEQKQYEEDKDMFEIKRGQDHVDISDFFTTNRLKVDVKTSYLSKHRRLLINKEQFECKKEDRKDFYVAIMLNRVPLKEPYKYTYNDKEKEVEIIDLDKLKTYRYLGAYIKGYISFTKLAEKRYINKFGTSVEYDNYGEGPCKMEFLNKLDNTEDLIKMF